MGGRMGGGGGFAGTHFFLPSLSINIRPNPPITKSLKLKLIIYKNIKNYLLKEMLYII
jgi:hypothetical protein